MEQSLTSTEQHGDGQEVCAGAREAIADIKHIVNVMICKARDGGYPTETQPLYEKFCRMLDKCLKEKK